MGRRCNVIKLRERIDRLAYRLVDRKGERDYALLGEVVLDPLGEIELVFDNRSIDGHARRSRAHTTHLALQVTKLRKRIVQLKIPLLPTAPCFHRDNAGSEAAILRQVGRAKNVDGFHAVDRYSQTKLPCCRIGYVCVIDDERTAGLAAAEEGQLPLIVPYDAR